MLRTDGTFEFYEIQARTKNSDWFFANFDSFGTPEGFSASGECWQLLGEYGTFDKAQAEAGLVWIAQKWRDYYFRLMKITITQVTEPVGELSLK